MRTLIDGYNLMHARGVLGRRLGPDGLRQARRRFLNDLAAALGPVESSQTTVIFDASVETAPGHLPRESSHKGLSVVFALGDEQSADERIEDLIAQHPSPRILTVVSTDLRLRRAALRRRARALTADEFWSGLESRRARKSTPRPSATTPEERGRREGPSESESAYWLEQFRHVQDAPEIAEAFRPPDFVPTDDEIARIEREVAEEP